VKVKCFGCHALIEADDSDAVADAFVSHGQESHTWAYPEEAMRNYARNYAEATERLRSMYDARGFEPIKVREHDTVVRRSAILLIER
jgi:hypothetical protein